MPRLPHACLIAVCLAGPLLLLPLYCAGLDGLDFNTTPSSEYDYNGTFDFSFFSNGSTEDLEMFLRGGVTDEVETDITLTDTEATSSTNLTKDQATRTACPSVLLALVLAAHQLLRLL